MESFLLPGLCFLACLWTPQAPRPMELNEVTSGIFSQCTWLVIPHTRLGASVVSPDNFWETQVSQQGLALKSAHPAVFSSFRLSVDVRWPQSYFAPAAALPTISMCSPSWKTFHAAFTSSLKGLNHGVFCTIMEDSVLLLRLRCRPSEFPHWERQMLTPLSTFPCTTLLPVRPPPTYLAGWAAPSEWPTHC